MNEPLCIDLYAGLGGWAEGFLAEGYRVKGYDIEAVSYTHLPAGFEDFVGKVCVWTMTNDLILLEAPRSARHLTVDESQNTQVRKLAPGEKITLVIRGE